MLSRPGEKFGVKGGGVPAKGSRGISHEKDLYWPGTCTTQANDIPQQEGERRWGHRTQFALQPQPSTS